MVELPPEVKLTVDGDSSRFAARSSGVSHAQIAELRAGKVRAEATVDLHGMTVEPALAQLKKFLVEARQVGHRCVLVVHGGPERGGEAIPWREAVTRLGGTEPGRALSRRDLVQLLATIYPGERNAIYEAVRTAGEGAPP